MPILNQLSRVRHLDDAALAATWAEASVAGIEPSHPHLAMCPDCRARLEAFGEWMNGLRREAVVEADEHFPAERLAAQQAHILRRIEAAERPARVIAFPTFARPMSPGTSHARRWIAAAAAAGLIVGLGVGQLMDLRHSVPGSLASSDFRRPEAARQVSTIQPVSASVNDNDAAFMADVDRSLSHNSLTQLHALDAITPRAPLSDGRQR